MAEKPSRTEFIASQIGEGMHAALRKFCESRGAYDAYTAIRDMPDDERSMV